MGDNIGPVMTEFRLPDIGDGLKEAEVVRWLVEEGNLVGKDEPLVEVETDKAVVTIPSPVAGTVVRHGAAAGETMLVGGVLAVIGSGDASPQVADRATPTAQPEPTVAAPQPREGPSEVKALPVVRRLARQQGVDLATVRGSGPGGQITRQDVLAASQTQASAVAPKQEPPEPGTTPEGSLRRPLSKLRRTIAANMARSWSEMPHVTTFDEVDATRLLRVKEALRQRHGAPVPMDALVTAAVVPALRRHPEFNATLDQGDLVTHSSCHIGVAINAAEGLLVAVVRDADQMSIMQLASTITDLAERGKARALGVDELTGHTFVISNIGALGGGYGTPIISPGNTAILAVGKVAEAPAAVDGEVMVRPIMPLSLSFDHRVIDGALSRLFMDLVLENLSEPALFLA